MLNFVSTVWTRPRSTRREICCPLTLAPHAGADESKESREFQTARLMPPNAEGFTLRDKRMESALVPFGEVEKVQALIPSRSEMAWGELSRQLSDSTSDEEKSELRAALRLISRQSENKILPIQHDSNMRRMMSILSTLILLKADCETLTSAMFYQSLREGYIAEEEYPWRSVRDSVLTIVEDALWLDELPATLHSLDDENAQLLGEYVIEATEDPRAVLVKLAEVLSTMRNIEELPLYEQHIEALYCLQIYVPLAHAVGVGKLMWELEDICFRVLFPESYAAVEGWHNRLWTMSESAINWSTSQILDELRKSDTLKTYTESFDVRGRTKNLFSTFKKMLRDNKKKEDVLDMVGIRVIVKMKDSYRDASDVERDVCLEVHRIITTIWPEMEGRFKNYISNPKPNGYQSIHTTVLFSDDLPIEVQVRTEDMHIAAEYGNASHHFYKGGLRNVEEVRRFANGMRIENIKLLKQVERTS